MTTCPLCGNRFEEGENTACSACPMGKECGTICCPNCGYQFVERSWIVDTWRSFRQAVISGVSGKKSRIDGA
jgi:hypothetical protein